MADQRILYTEYGVGAGHPTLADTLNRLILVEHLNTGVHSGGDLCHLKTGTYIGNGAVSKAITGIGFSPKYVKIVKRPTNEAGSPTYEKLNQAWGDYCDRHAITANQEHYVYDHRIKTLDADGFTVDDDSSDSSPNANGIQYNYFAIG
jgi:hypothetical protein